MTERVEWQGRYLEVHEIPWGKNGRWEYVKRRNNMEAAVILALTDAADIVLVEQFRPPLGRSCLELPAGLIGDTDEAENPLHSAQRELIEETGFRARHWEPLGTFASSPGVVGEIFHLFRATGLQKVGPGGGVDENENITPHVVPLAGLPAFVTEARARGVVIDVRIALGLGFIPPRAG